MKTLKCATYSDELKIVDVESCFSKGLPGFDIVGLASTSIKESTQRVKASLLALGFSFPAQKITINLSPSDFPKSGSHFDLSIALLIALQKEKMLKNFFVFGELGLDGSVKNTTNLFSILLFLSTKVKTAKLIVPSSIAQKASMIPNLEIYSVSNLNDAIKIFLDDDFEAKCKITNSHPLFENFTEIDGEKYIHNSDYELDFADVLGQSRAKRACLIAATGMHNIIFEGSPGCGKSMCAKRLLYILPPQSTNEVLKSSAYRSLSMQDSEFSTLRAFRAPHHTSTKSSIFGGGSSTAKIGEVALANNGILFFDEFPHFNKHIIESLREPIQEHKIHISCVNSKVTYDTNFIFVAALNPCPCGNLLSKNLDCNCSELEIKRYRSKLSQPILDRIELLVQMDEISPNDKNDMDSKSMHKQVLDAFKFAKSRLQKNYNANLSDKEINKFCILQDDANAILNLAISKHNLSQRGIKNILKVARSIADLELCDKISKSHILEAISFKNRV